MYKRVAVDCCRKLALLEIGCLEIYCKLYQVSCPSRQGPKPLQRLNSAPMFYPDITINVRAADAAKFEQTNNTFLSVDKLEYITFNSDKSCYLYSICAVLFEVPTKQLTILKSSVGAVLPEDSEEWQVVEGEDPITKGNYLLICEKSSCNPPYILSCFVLTICSPELGFVWG